MSARMANTERIRELDTLVLQNNLRPVPFP